MSEPDRSDRSDRSDTPDTRQSLVARPLQRQESGPRTDALALADAMSAVFHAAEAMEQAGDLAPLHIEDLHTAAAEARRLDLFQAIRRVHAIRTTSQTPQTPQKPMAGSHQPSEPSEPEEK